jgi:uncharacterized RmlC-like cupin family protein
MATATVLHLDELTPGPGTPGMARFVAFSGEDRWIGRVTSDPGVTSGWHHHGQHDTYFQVATGGTRLEFEDGSTLDAGPGDFVHIPAGTVHRESSVGADRLEVILVRIGTGPQVVDVPDPAA